MIRLAGASVRNYKGIAFVDISFHTGGATAVQPLIGLNESGKTTVLEALTLIASTNEDLSALGFTGLKKQENHELIPIARRSNFTGDIEVTLEFVCDEEDTRKIASEFEETSGYILSHFATRFKLQRTISFEDSKETSSATRYILNYSYQKKKKRQKGPDGQDLWPHLSKAIAKRLPSILFAPNFLFDIPPQIELGPLKEVEPKHAFFHRLFDGLLKSLDPDLSFDTHVVQRAMDPQGPTQTALDATITKLQHCIQSQVLGHWAQVFGSSLGELRIKLAIKTEGFKKYLVITIQHDADEYKISDRTLGFRWFFSFLMLTFYRESRGDRQTVFLLDEPASNLHAGAQARLLACFGRMDNTLFVYATHSHYLITPEMLPLTFVAKNHGYDQKHDEAYVATKTDIRVQPYRRFVSDYPDQTDHFRVALDVLDVPLSSFQATYPCVFFEGKSDYYAARFAQLCGAWDLDAAVFPCGGVNTMDSRVFDALAQEEVFLFVADGDTAGMGVSRKLLERYGELLMGRVITMKEIDKVLVGAESWFSDSDRARILNLAGITGKNKRKFQRAVELLVATGGTLVLDKESRARLKAICTRLRKELSARSR